MLTLLQLEEKLGEQYEFFTNECIPVEERKKYVEVAKVATSIAKQIINGADVALRTEKLYAEGKLSGDATIIKLLGKQ